MNIPTLLLAAGGMDPQWILLVLAPLGLAAAAWALRLACSFSLVDPPGFLHATYLVATLIVANVAVRFFLEVTGTQPGLSTRYAVPAIINAIVLTIGLPVNPVSAFMVAVAHVVISCLMYLGCVIVGTALF
ncbi:MAG: hypothetical protein RH917_01670 [Lacipirellulaceae bacterium]